MLAIRAVIPAALSRGRRLDLAAPTNEISLDSVSSSHRIVLRARNAVLNATKQTSISRLLMIRQAADVKMDNTSSGGLRSLSPGRGGSVGYSGAVSSIPEITAGRTIDALEA